MLASRVNPSSPTEGIGGPWHQLIAEFQSRVLSRYATVLMTDFEVLSGGNGVKCEYDTITVVANCDTGESLPYGEHRLPPEGVLVTSASGDLIAGVVDQLNGAPLAPGDHYLIIETDGDTIFVRQPMGGDTRLRLDALAGWAAQDSICVSAWDPDTNLIDAAAVRVQNDTIGFDYRNVVDGQHVAYYKIYKSNTVPAEAWNVFYNDYELPHIVLGNRDWYELYIAKFNGGIAGIVDKTTGDTITIGSNGGILWSVDFPGDPHPGRADPVHGFDELGFAPHKFTYEWDETARTLTLTYARDTTAQYGIDVSVEITISEEPYFDMRIALDNAWGSAQQVDFPYDLLVPSDPGDRYIIPYSYPGLEIDAAFFEGSTAFQAFYPSELLADYAAVVSSAGTMAIYGLHEGDSVSKVALGLARSLDPAQGELPVYRHAYLVDSDSGTSWTSPTLRFRVGQDEMALLAGMRADNGIDAYESASAKLGERFATAARSPLIAVCFENPGDPPFSQIAARLASIRGPAAVMLSGFQQGGMDGHHPCYLPPDNQWGPEEDFTRMIGDLHAQGKMVIPYTRPSWWHANSPTVQGIGSMEAVAQLDESGAPVQQVFGGEETGYRISPYGTGVEDTLARMVRELKGEMGADMLMAARLGSRHDADYNVNAPSHDLYDYGWLETLGAFADSLLIVENGYDRMASPACGFTGSMYDDVSSGSAHWDEIFGAGNWRGYPAGPALLGDKVIAFQPMERSLLSKDMLSFCLLHGMAPSFMPQDGSPDRPYTSPWMRVASVFQAHAGPWTAGQRLVSLTRPTGGVVSADYGDVTVIRNARSSAYASGSHTVAPYGALMVADNGALVAGILTRYNGASLASGDHYLVVTTADSVITVHHPMGAATGLSLPRPAAWSDASQILARAVLTKDSVVEVSATIDEAGVELDLVRSVNGDSVSHFVVTYGGKQSTAARVANPRPAFKLFHSLPNPFHSYTRIRYQVPEEGRVLLRVFDAGGREVRRLVDRVQKPGRYAVVWQADDTRAPLSSGMYLCEIRIGTRRAVRTIMKTK
jgi:hypothetical protein